MLELANLIRKQKAFENKMSLFSVIEKNPECTVYDLTKITKWTVGKVNYYVKKLLKDNVINNSTLELNGRILKRYTAKTIKELINWKEMEYVKKEDFET